MKKTSYLGFLLLSLIFINCQKEENSSDVIKGTVSVNIGLFVSVHEVENSLKSTADADDFKVIIRKGSEDILIYDHASEMPEVIDLDPGQYIIIAHSNNDLPAAFENPYFYGESSTFTVNPGSSQNINVNCEIANTAVSIVYSEQIKNGFTDYKTTVTTTAGSLVFLKDETRTGYFQSLSMQISAELIWTKSDGSLETKTINGTIDNPLPRKRYAIHIDAVPSSGSVAFQINVDETMDPVEIVNITDHDPDINGLFNQGDLLITEIMYDPVSLSDAEGEWFEIYNNTNLPVDLNNLVIRKNDTEQHTVTGSILVNAHAYQVMAKTELAITGNKYIYGSSLSLNNTGAVLSLYNYGTNGTDGSLICAVNYGDESFRSATGASLSLSPVLLNYTAAVSGTSWCISTSSYTTGDKGTPGLINDTCL